MWAVNGPWALQESVSALDRIGKTATGLQAGTREDHESLSHHLLFTGAFAKVAVPLSPFRQSERLRTQRATFLVPGEISVGFMENLRALPGHDCADHLVRIVIPSKLRPAAMEQLYAMNISRTSLFPGLDGYAQSLGIFHPSFRPDPYLEEK